MSNESILVVEDDAVVIKVLETHLKNAGYNVVGAANAAEAIRATVTKQPDLMILDLTLLDGVSVNGLRDGLSVLQWLRRTLPEARFPVIVHTSDSSPDLVERTAPYGVSSVFRKGTPAKELLDAVRQALDARRAGPAAEAA
jgi:CheY-like chemotaxis protein